LPLDHCFFCLCLQQASYEKALHYQPISQSPLKQPMNRTPAGTVPPTMTLLFNNRSALRAVRALNDEGMGYSHACQNPGTAITAVHRRARISRSGREPKLAVSLRVRSENPNQGGKVTQRRYGPRRSKRALWSAPSPIAVRSTTAVDLTDTFLRNPYRLEGKSCLLAV
jgi:hypothetical protein